MRKPDLTHSSSALNSQLVTYLTSHLGQINRFLGLQFPNTIQGLPTNADSRGSSRRICLRRQRAVHSGVKKTRTNRVAHDRSDGPRKVQ